MRRPRAAAAGGKPGRLRLRLVHACTVAILLGAAGCSEDDARTTAAEHTATSSTPSQTPVPATSPEVSAPSDGSPSGSAKPPSPPSLTAQERARLNRRLIAAAWANDVPRARRLISRGAEVNAEDKTQQSAFLIATSEGHLKLLKLTLQHGADVDAKDSFNGTGLIRAADRGHWDITGRLVQAGAEVDHVNNLGWTALHEAINLGDGTQRYLDTVRVLVAAGADVLIPSERDGVTPLEHASTRGYGAVADLLSRAARSNPGKGDNPAAADRRLLTAASAGEADAAALALRAGAHLEARDERSLTPLLLAVAHNRLPTARVLVALGADPDALDDRHDTPWLVTGATGAEVLLTADPDLSIRNRFGGVSVIPASERGHVEYVRRVVRTSILNGVTADAHAVARGQDELVRILRRHR